jgi:SAM-dependent methyltransferase
MKRTVTDRQWDKWANDDPYRGVLGVDTSSLNDDEVKAAFFESGERHIAYVLGLVDTFLGGANKSSAALDFGCGVGRLLRPLASRFDRVTGIDIAPKMLEIAQSNLADFNNIQLSTDLGAIAQTGNKFGFVHSYIVLQHIRPKQGEPIIEQLVDLVDDGGIFALHVTTGDSNPLRSRMNWVRYRFPPAHWAYNAARKRPVTESITEMNTYDTFRILEITKAAGCAATLTVPFNQNGHKGIMFIGKIEKSRTLNA